MIILKCNCCGLDFQAEAHCEHREVNHGWCRTCIQYLRNMRPFGRPLAVCELELLQQHELQQWPGQYSPEEYGRRVVALVAEADHWTADTVGKIADLAIRFGLARMDADDQFRPTLQKKQVA